MNKEKIISTTDKCDLCTSSICCTYVTQEIDSPTSIYDYDTMLWQLYHHSIQFYKEEGSWYLKILNHCLNLQPDGRCGVYDVRPMICREHENDFCEYDESTETSADVFFGKPEDLEAFCRKKYKSWDKRYKKFK